MQNNAYSGPGLWIRISHRFGPRMTEWILAVIMTLWGYSLFVSDDFSGPSFAMFRLLFSQEGLGWTMVIVGSLRLAGLIINGSRKKVTPWIRVLSASIGFMIFGGIVYCFASSGIINDWIAIYPVFAFVELINVYRAAHDAGENYAIAGPQ